MKRQGFASVGMTLLCCTAMSASLYLGPLGCSSTSPDEQDEPLASHASGESAAQQPPRSERPPSPSRPEPTGSASPPSEEREQLDDSPQEAPKPSEETLLLDVELAEDKPDFACGFATISMIAHYYDRTVPSEIGDDIRETVEEYGGLRGGQVSDYFEQLGFHAEPYVGRLEASSAEHKENESQRGRSLLGYLDEERPVVVLMRHPRAMRNHFGVIVGHDPGREKVALLDPGLGLQWMSYESFEESWEEGRRFMLVPIPAKEVVW